MKLPHPTLRALVGLATFATPLVLVTPAVAQRQAARPPATEAFSFCRAEEDLGDARACWSIWLERHRKTGTEAELAYAESHSTSSQAPARLRLTTKPSGASVTLDGRVLGKTPREGLSVSPGEHRVVFVHDGHSEGRTFTVTEGEQRTVDFDFDAPPPLALAGPGPAPREPLPGGDVLDFCALSPHASSRKERVVLLAPSRSGSLDDDAGLRAIDAASIVREVVAARFAMDRFHNVLGSMPGKSGWEKRESLGLAEVRAFVASPAAAVDAGGASGERLERERPFIGYSLGCADYLAIPVITGHDSRWREARAGDSDATGNAPSLVFKMDGVLAIFRRTGDTFERIALLSASAPSFDELPIEPQSVAHPEAKSSGGHGETAARARDLPRYLSAVPEPTCLLGKTATDGVAGLAACGRGEGTVEQSLGDLDERSAVACERARDPSASDEERRTFAVRCAVRSRAYELAHAFALEARNVDRWNVFSVLGHTARPTFTLGRADGVKVGDAFEVLDANHERIAFFKATKIGPGGAEGVRSPTVLSDRLGDAPPGSRVDVHPQLGLVIAPYAAFSLLADGYGITTVHSGVASQDFTLPSTLLGGGLAVGFDLSSLVRSSEVFLRASGGIFTGNGLNTSAMLVPFDLWVEKGFYLTRRLTLTGGLGGTVQLNALDVLAAVGPFQQDLHLSNITYGPTARLGLDVMLAPEWSVKAEAVVRVPFNDAPYAESTGQALPGEWNDRTDHFATMSLNVGIAKTF